MAKIDSFDAFVLVTAEYNHGIRGTLKNAIDFLFKEQNCSSSIQAHTVPGKLCKFDAGSSYCMGRGLKDSKDRKMMWTRADRISFQSWNYNKSNKLVNK